jgi:hypothetical protein
VLQNALRVLFGRVGVPLWPTLRRAAQRRPWFVVAAWWATTFHLRIHRPARMRRYGAAGVLRYGVVLIALLCADQRLQGAAPILSQLEQRIE